MNHAQFTSSGYSFVNGLKAVTRYATASKLLFKDACNFVSSPKLKKIFTILHALNIQKVYTKDGDFKAALKFFNMKQDNSLKIKIDVTQNIEKPASEDNENFFSPILNVFKNMMETSNIIDKYITAIPHLMSIGFTLKKISSPNHVISKFDAIKVPALMAAATAIGKPLIDTIREDCSTIIQFFKDSNKLLTGAYNFFGNNNEDFTYYQLEESHQDNQVDVIGVGDSNIY